MSKTILLIENDAAFARDLTEALEGEGFAVRQTGDGKEGLDLARETSPAAIVLCVELPKMSGYSICQKLKKDEALRAIPLLLTSAEATAETFEQHKKLKARAEDYLLKPYRAAALLEKLGALVGLPEPRPAEHTDEEVVSLEEDLGLEALAADADTELPALDLGSVADAPLPDLTARPGADEDLRLLDDAFDGLSQPPPAAAGDALDLALSREQPVPVDELDAAAASLPEVDERPARAALGSVADDADLALGALGTEESPSAALDALAGLEPSAATGPSRLDLGPELVAALDLGPAPEAAPPAPPAPPHLGLARLDEPLAPPSTPAPAPLPRRAFDEASLAAAGSSTAELARLEADLADRRAAVAARDAEIRDLHDRVDALTQRAVEAESAAAERDAEIAGLKGRGEALASQAKKLEAELKTGREESRRAADQGRAADDRARAAEERFRASEDKARAADERARAGEEKARGAEERARAAEAQAAQAGERHRAAEAQAAGLLGEVERHKAAHAETSRGLEAKVAELAVASAAAARLEATERELEELKTELIVARGEVEGARSEVEKRSAELKRRIGELEAANAKNEERVVKAYLKIKGDEKVRDKTRKALSIALQLLEEGLPAEPAEKRPSSGTGATKLE